MTRDGYDISTDPARLDIDAIWQFLTNAYWSPGVERERVERSIANSLVFGVYAQDGSQAGFARLVTDRATFGWLADLFVLEPHRGHGLGAWLVETILAHPDVAQLRQVLLATKDAQTLYARFGFEAIEGTRLMALRRTKPAAG